MAVKNKAEKLGNTAELAELLNISTRRVNQLVDQEVLRREAEGCFNLPVNIAAYYEFKLGSKEEADYLEEKAKHEAAKRQLAELELAKRQDEVHDADDVEAVMTDMLTNIRSQLLALPSKMAPILANRDKGYISKVLNDEIESRLTELSDYEPGIFDRSADVDEAEDD